MAINEVFPNPTVKQVIFQIRFPALFAMESLVGDLQVKIMDNLPDSRLIQQTQVVIYLSYRADRRTRVVAG